MNLWRFWSAGDGDEDGEGDDERLSNQAVAMVATWVVHCAGAQMTQEAEIAQTYLSSMLPVKLLTLLIGRRRRKSLKPDSGSNSPLSGTLCGCTSERLKQAKKLKVDEQHARSLTVTIAGSLPPRTEAGLLRLWKHLKRLSSPFSAEKQAQRSRTHEDDDGNGNGAAKIIVRKIIKWKFNNLKPNVNSEQIKKIP